MTKSFSTPAILAAALSTAVIMASPAAYAEDVPQQAKVSWQDLDLHTDAGQRLLARRTEFAANRVCPNDEVTGTHLRSADIDKCRASVRAQVARHVAAEGRMALGN